MTALSDLNRIRLFGNNMKLRLKSGDLLKRMYHNGMSFLFCPERR
nr:MAG TPA: hypothetical protein [Caudoviricetes sp.]